jgi:acetyl esterase/lipase
MKFPYLIVSILVLTHFFLSQVDAATKLFSGTSAVLIKEFSEESSREKTVCFLPDTQKRVPCVIFCHAFEEQYQSYYELILHCVSKGMSVVYVSIRKVTFTRNKIRDFDFGLTSIVNAVHSFKNIDTSRIMIIGHGFGAGAAPALMKQLREKEWGSNAAMMYLMSPWYLYSIDERQLSAYPDSVSMLVEVFDKDNYNDPMIAADIFTQIGIPDSQKAFLIVRSDNVGIRKSTADYLLPLGDQSLLGECDYLDTLAIFNVVDSLLCYGFNVTECKGYAILQSDRTFDMNISENGTGDSVPPIIVTDSPFVHIPKGPYLNAWQSVRNPRIDVSRFRKFRKLTMRYQINKIDQVSRYLVRKIAVDVEHDTSDAVTNPIDSGFGENGPYKTLELVCDNPKYPQQRISVFLPESIKTPVPVILFLHGYNGGDPSYFSHLIPHMVSNGYGVIFPTYSSFPTVNASEVIMQKYDMLYTGICEAYRLNKRAFDSSRVGIFGHSFGGGAVPWMASKMFSERKWGSKASFLFVSAPWYMYGVNDSSLKLLPSQMKAAILTYSDDAYNDHQMAVDMFNHLNVPLTEKRFFMFQSDTLDSMVMIANHFVPYGNENINGVEDNFDYFGIFKLFDAISSYSFKGNRDGKLCALGNNSEIQNWMGVWHDGTPVKPLFSTTTPKAKRPQNSFVFAWENPLNPRTKAEFPERGNR